jgi:phosphatidylserine decarboxylase
VLIVFAVWRYCYFFRDPDRPIPVGRNIVSPADGRVVYIRAFEKGTVPIAIKKAREISLTEVTKCAVPMESGHIIGIYMTLWDVHVNRAPIAGTIEQIAYHDAVRNRSMTIFGFQMILRHRSTPGVMGHILENERNTICVRGDFTLCLVQIADFYVNRIRCWVQVGQQVQKGERIGQIIMGSQVDLILPAVEGLSIVVKEGSKIKAGETVVATY